jgi:membrane dipeptidase
VSRERRTLALALLLMLAGAGEPDALRAQDDPALARARRLLASTPLIDGHNDLAWEIRTSPTAPRDVAA